MKNKFYPSRFHLIKLVEPNSLCWIQLPKRHNFFLQEDIKSWRHYNLLCQQFPPLISTWEKYIVSHFISITSSLAMSALWPPEDLKQENLFLKDSKSAIPQCRCNSHLVIRILWAQSGLALQFPPKPPSVWHMVPLDLSSLAPDSSSQPHFCASWHLSDRSEPWLRSLDQKINFFQHLVILAWMFRVKIHLWLWYRYEKKVLKDWNLPFLGKLL